ncbi:MAG: hypothetical protein ACI9HX_000539, partial [Pseudoalteromonas tetraodonis]
LDSGCPNDLFSSVGSLRRRVTLREMHRGEKVP